MKMSVLISLVYDMLFNQLLYNLVTLMQLYFYRVESVKKKQPFSLNKPGCLLLAMNLCQFILYFAADKDLVLFISTKAECAVICTYPFPF